MLLDIEVSVRVQNSQWHELGPGTTNGVGEQLGHQGTDRNTGLAKIEKLVQTAADLGFGKINIVAISRDVCFGMRR